MPENEVSGTEGKRKANGAVNEPIGEGGDKTCSEEEVRGERSMMHGFWRFTHAPSRVP